MITFVAEIKGEAIVAFRAETRDDARVIVGDKQGALQIDLREMQQSR
jgi:hypothetical protein